MKKLSSFLITENREPKLNSVQGKEAEKNGLKGGEWGVNEPKDDEPAENIDKKNLSKNMKRLLMKFKTEEDFFIIGQAGWGKTSIIKDMAKRFKREVVTVYLDKAVASDLGGIPIPVKGKSGAVQEMAMPAWAKVIEDNPDKKFLLFFDEMNQAAPDVMNALMPIVLEHEICGHKFKNFFVGAAGNFESENGAVNELSGPLRSRFKPLIVWETGGDSWREAFDYLHKHWDDKLSKKLVDEFEDNAESFENPREVEQKIFKFIYNLKQDGDNDYFDTDDYLDRLEGLTREDLSRTQENNIKKLAESIYSFINSKNTAEDEEESGGRSGRKRKDSSMVPENVKMAIKQGMKFGYIEDNGVKWGISRENISVVVDSEDCNAEMLDRIISKFEADGIKFKFNKNSEFKAKGYKDPEND